VTVGAIETLWRKYLRTYAEDRIRAELQSAWATDPNVTQSRIQFDYPPTFQPGYIGPAYSEAESRILFVGYNPGEGKLQSSRDEDNVLARKLRDFAEGAISFEELREFQAGHVVKWPIYREKGIFSETRDSAIALLPVAARPSVRSVALLNLFPFKTIQNKKPLAGYGNGASLKEHMWEYLIRPTIEALAPRVIVRYPDADAYESMLAQLSARPRIIRVWHPSDYNLSAQRTRLAEAWLPLGAELLAAVR